jgi:hypothetical protein
VTTPPAKAGGFFWKLALTAASCTTHSPTTYVSVQRPRPGHESLKDSSVSLLLRINFYVTVSPSQPRKIDLSKSRIGDSRSDLSCRDRAYRI